MVAHLPILKTEGTRKLAPGSALVEGLGADELAQAGYQQRMEAHLAMGGLQLQELERSVDIARSDRVQKVPRLDLGRAYHVPLDISHSDLRRLEHRCQALELVVEHA